MRLFIANVAFLLIHCSHSSDESNNWKNIVRTDDFSDLISQPYVALFFAHSAGPQDSFARRFNSQFADAEGHLEDFGVEVAVIDCFTSPEFNECVKKKEDSDKVHFFRHGRLLTDLPLDSMFNFDAIVANILHLVLLQEVPLLQTRAELEEMMRRTSGKRDVIFARMRAVGIFEDRAFIETAFAFNQKYQFIMTTVNDNFGIDSNWEPGSNSIWLLQCKNTIPGKQCPAIPFMNAISLEKLIVFIKGLEVTNAVELTEGSHVGFLHLTIPVVYLSGSNRDIQGLRSTMHTLATEFMGNVGFILVNRDMVTENMQATWDLSTSLKCTSVCAVLETEDSLETIDEFTIEDLRLGVKKILEKQRSEDLEHKEDDEDIDEDEDEDEDDGSSEELYSTSQETQDDPVEVALFKLQADRQLNISETVQLTDKTFPEFISSTSVTMVLFTVKWNPICTAFLEAYQKIGLKASELNDINFNPMARVECSNWPDVCGLNNVTMYPTLKIFKESVQTKDYLGGLGEVNVLKSYFLQTSSSPVYLTTREQFSSFYDGSYPTRAREVISSVIIGIFSDTMNADAIIFEEVSKHLEGSFLLGICIQECSNEGLKTFGVKHSTIITVKWDDPYQPFVIFDGAFNKPTILSFLYKSSQHILPELNPASLPSLLGNSESIVMFFHQQDHRSKYAEIELAKVASRKQFDTTPITWVDASDKGHLGRKILSSYSLPVEGNIPQVVLLSRKTNSVCWYPHTPQFSESLLTDWLDATLTGRERSCAAALRHREWTEMVQGYDFLAYIKEDQEAGAEKKPKVNLLNGRLKQTKSHKETRDEQSDDNDRGEDREKKKEEEDNDFQSGDEEMDHHIHREL